jgi:hypothetical protein
MIENFIGIYEYAFTKEYCNEVIEFYNVMDKLGFTSNRQAEEKIPKIKKDDTSFFIQDLYTSDLDASVMPVHLFRHFNECFWDFYNNNYESNFDILTTYARHHNYNLKIQKTEIGEGYHMWHSENMHPINSNRILAWQLYLNDVEEGGETEFLYYSKRIKPKSGTLVMWPASFTHTHRGNPPLSNKKYVMTGWLTI